MHGQKVWTSRGAYSRWGLLLARHDPAVPKHQGITAFGLDMHAPGVEVRPLRQMNGDAHFTEVFLDDALVADADRIGDAGEGWRVALTCLSYERGAVDGRAAAAACSTSTGWSRSPARRGLRVDPVRARRARPARRSSTR